MVLYAVLSRISFNLSENKDGREDLEYYSEWLFWTVTLSPPSPSSNFYCSTLKLSFQFWRHFAKRKWQQFSPNKGKHVNQNWKQIRLLKKKKNWRALSLDFEEHLPQRMGQWELLWVLASMLDPGWTSDNTTTQVRRWPLLPPSSPHLEKYT